MDTQVLYKDLEADGYDREQIGEYFKQHNFKMPPSDWDSGFRAFTQGVTWGQGEEMEAGFNKMFDFDGEDQTYTELRDQYRGEMKSWQKEHPIAAPLLEFGGGLLSGGALAKGFQVGKGAISQGWPAMRSLIGLGAAEGAMSGYGHSESDNPVQQGIDTVSGGVSGGAMGGATYPLTRGAQGLANSGPQGAADKTVRRSLQDDARINSADEAIDAMRIQGGDDAIIGDIEGTRSAFRGAAQQARGDNAQRYMERRFMGMPRKLEQTVKHITDIQGTPNAYKRLLVEQRGEAADTNYAAALGIEVDPDKILHTLKNEWGQTAFKRAKARMELRYPEQDFNFDDPAAIRNLEFWDYYKRALDGMAKKAGRAGDNDLAGGVSSMSGKVKRTFDAQTNGKYKKARDSFAHSSRIVDAVDEGRDILRKRDVFPEDVEERIAEMSQDERMGLLKGISSELQLMALHKSSSANTALNILKRPATRQIIRLAMGDPKKADDFLIKLKQFARKGEVAGEHLNNSNTAAKQAEMRAANEVGDVAMSAAQGNYGAAVKGTAGAFNRFRKGGVDAAQHKLVADAFLKQNPEAAEYLHQIFRAGETPARIATTMTNLAAPFAGSYGGPDFAEKPMSEQETVDTVKKMVR